MSSYSTDKKLISLLVETYDLEEEELKCLLKTLEPRKKVVKKTKKPASAATVLIEHYSEKAGLIKGLDYRENPALKDAVKELGLLRWNAGLKGFIFSWAKLEKVQDFLDEQSIKYDMEE